MQKKLIYIFLGIIAVVIIAVVAGDILGSRPDKRGDNPFALEVSDLKEVDPALIIYNETKNLKLQSADFRGLDIKGDELFIISDNQVQVISTTGEEIRSFELPKSPRAILVDKERIFVGFLNSVSAFSLQGELLKDFAPVNDTAVITNMAMIGDNLFVADAGNRQVIRYSKDGELFGSFGGKREEDDLHGFIVPSANFDLVNNGDDLWVVNPGRHALENYSSDGDLRGYWESISNTTEGFAGCCNPARISVLPDGRFITSEKGIVRIKVYELSGKFAGVVAAPEKFDENGAAPDIAVSEDGIIYALDFNRDVVRVFEEK